MEKTSSAAQEESSFLTEHMQSLLDERTALKEALEKAQREKEVRTRQQGWARREAGTWALLVLQERHCGVEGSS